MSGIAKNRPFVVLWVGVVLCGLLAGCQCLEPCFPPDVPRELAKVSLPPYVIEPPDVLVIDATRLVPKPPYKVEPFDVLAIRVVGALPEQPIAGLFSVEPEGTVTLGFDYGTARVAGLTTEKAREALEKALRRSLKPGYTVTVAVAESRAMQQVRGPHLVRIDGTVGLGSYGSVYIDNLTIADAKAAIEQHLSQFLLDPQISLDVSGYNSKVYYVITDGGGFGEQVYRLPMTGKTTVLDAIGFINGLPPVASKGHIWVARPAPDCTCGEQTLRVDWVGLTQRGEPTTNYQLLPGDRLYVKAAPLVKLDTSLARIFSPIERTFGVLLLGSSTYQGLRGTNVGGTGVGR